MFPDSDDGGGAGGVDVFIHEDEKRVVLMFPHHAIASGNIEEH